MGRQPPRTLLASQTQGSGGFKLDTHSWELPPSVVHTAPLSPYREEDRIGSYGQPRWTARRLFPTTRVYVRPEGQFEFEYWTRVKVPDHGPSTVENMYEAEIGLPHRFQFDLYLVGEKTGKNGDFDFTQQKFELRYALADWGVIPLNPTLYAEYVEADGSDKVELKLLLGTELAPGWHAASNMVWEHEIEGDLANEYEITLGIARTIVDEKLSVGMEMKATLVDAVHMRGNVLRDTSDFEKEFEIGPTVQWRPLPQMHIDFAPLLGIGPDSRRADIYAVLGWEF